MNANWLLRFAVFVMVVTLIAILAWVTLYEEDPCANAQADVGGAILATEPGDQDALVNRAIMVRARAVLPTPEGPSMIRACASLSVSSLCMKNDQCPASHGYSSVLVPPELFISPYFPSGCFPPAARPDLHPGWHL